MINSITAVKDEFPSIPPYEVELAELDYSMSLDARKRNSLFAYSGALDVLDSYEGIEESEFGESRFSSLSSRILLGPSLRLLINVNAILRLLDRDHQGKFQSIHKPPADGFDFFR